MHMKKFLLLSLALLLLLPGCWGKQEPAEQPQTSVTDDTESSQTAPEDDTAAPAEDPQENTEEQAEEVPMPTMEEMESMVNEFNDPNIDPEKKEELRTQLEAILKQAEQQAPAQ